MTLIANDEYDKRICPQEMGPGTFHVPTERTVDEELADNNDDVEG